MGLFDRLLSKLTASTSTPSTPATPATSPYSTGGIEITITGPAGPAAEVSYAEVAERAKAHCFVLTTDPPALRNADQWWNEETHKRRRREGSEKAYAWLLPFLPLEVAKYEQLKAAQEWGPHGASGIAKELRALIRQRRKAKEPYQALLLALYGACVAADLSASLSFEGTQPHYMARFVDINEVQSIKIDYPLMGYQCIESLTKTDVKWLIESFGEPAEHQSFESIWPNIRRNAVARYCWSELRSKNDSAKSLGWPQQTIQEWLNELVKRNIGYHKEWQERVAARHAYLEEQSTVLEAAWSATRQTFVVADLETTGLNAEKDEVLEFAAIRAESNGNVTESFSVLVRASVSIPAEITRLTGISQTAIDIEGRPLSEAMSAFIAFVRGDPVFFHNAPFDVGFIKKASVLAKIKFTNPVHDTLPLARQAWPSLGTYKLAALTEHIGAPSPTHRALADATAALAVLLAARKKVVSNG